MNLPTKLSAGGDEGIRVRGYSLDDLITGASFADCVCLLLTGELPSKKSGRMLEAILVSAIDHGVNAPSIHVARAAASCGVPVATAVAAGISAIGTNHGGAGEACARNLQTALASTGDRSEEGLRAAAATMVAETLRTGGNMPGFGHRIYKVEDPRSRTLLALARELGLSGDHVRLALHAVDELERAKGRRLVLNVDGAQAAILSDMGFPWRRVQSLFIIGRSAGLCAHALEEIESASPLRYLKAAPVEECYEGPEDRRPLYPEERP